ncbi:alpha/beta fold hydrolase [Nonomuraea composti]|uniref:alpha/beta fold hydrolase n=1 Tax=Nonomuraea composti TaxID=2720023 RepID=UPI001F117967|nr:alpha/beta hydrolase [Nonomuraea sp. FMUSA5-5]
MNMNRVTEFLEVDGGRIAYDVTGQGPLIVLAPGMGNNRAAFHPMAADLAAAGFRVATTDLRGHGESSDEWPSYTRADVAGDLLALVKHLGGPAAIVGHSFSGGSATIAAAQEPDLVTAIVEFAPFTRVQKMNLGGMFSNARYRKGTTLLMGAILLRNVGLWKRYLDHAYPGAKPAGYAESVAALEADLRKPGRMAVVGRFGLVPAADAEARLADVRCPALIVMGTLDPDWADPRAEGEAIVAAMQAGIGRLHMVEGAGHYPHAQFPHEMAEVVLDFLGAGPRG